MPSRVERLNAWGKLRGTGTPYKDEATAEMARCLALRGARPDRRSRVLIIDELSPGSPPLLARQLFDTLRDLKSERLTILRVEQNLHPALALSYYAYVFAEGKMHSEGPSREVARNLEVRKACMGMQPNRPGPALYLGRECVAAAPKKNIF